VTPEIAVGIGGILTSIIVAAVIYGRLTQRVDDGDKKTIQLELGQKEHGSRLSGLDLKVDRLEQWRSGFSDAAHVAGVSSSLTSALVAEAVDRRAAIATERKDNA
jgi:hypothetical protein